MARLDPHSFFDSAQPRTRSFDLDLTVDFDRRRLAGAVTLHFGEPAGGALDLDARDLEISGVVDDRGREVPFSIAESDPIMGQRLRLDLPGDTSSVTVRYSTSPDASALQWLTPEQTAGRRHPFLFSQCQAIHARSMAPLQDTPLARAPYKAAIKVPAPLAAVMSAGTAGERQAREPGFTTFLFDMPQPIPPYLLALAVGDLASRDIGPRSRVWAEPETVEQAAFEFAEIEKQIKAAEGLFGPYEWERFDLLVLPPSFPYGGMENPRLTFLTPTLLAGDRSLVDVVVHELAHSWTGNLVTNATMDHFWLNEGFTVWAERRILEALHGVEAATIGWALGQKSLEQALERFGADSPLTKLRTDLAGVDPDDAFSQVPYEKGARFVVALEHALGRPAFDKFIRKYIERFRFTSLTTEQFVEFIEQEAPGVAARVDARSWLYEPGLRADAPSFSSPRLAELEQLAAGWSDGRRPASAITASWTPAELQVYLQRLPREIDAAGCRWLDEHFQLTARGNYEILVEWLTIAAGSNYEPVFPRVREVLTRVGRMKYLRPLYGALGRHPRTQALARETFASAKDTYHALSRRVVESVMDKYT